MMCGFTKGGKCGCFVLINNWFFWSESALWWIRLYSQSGSRTCLHAWISVENNEKEKIKQFVNQMFLFICLISINFVEHFAYLTYMKIVQENVWQNVAVKILCEMLSIWCAKTVLNFLNSVFGPVIRNFFRKQWLQLTVSLGVLPFLYLRLDLEHLLFDFKIKL